MTLLGARYYDESVGRFVSVDPLLDAGLPAQFNAYVYSGNNPATFSDPLGTTWKSDKPDNLPGSKSSSGSSSKSSSSSGAKNQPGTTAPAPTSWAARDACAGNMWCLYSWGFGAGMQAVGGCAEGLVDLVAFTTGIPMLVESVQDGYQAVTDWDGYSAKKQAERDAMWGVVTGGPEAWGHAFVDPIVDEWENNPGHLVGGATFTAATFIVPGAGEIKALRGVKGAVDALKIEKTIPEGIVYLRTDVLGGKPYVGQAKSESRFLARQSEHSRDHPDADFEFEILGRANPGTDLDRMEEFYIRGGGGPTNKSNPGGGLSNSRHQMSDSRYLGAGGDLW